MDWRTKEGRDFKEWVGNIKDAIDGTTFREGVSEYTGDYTISFSNCNVGITYYCNFHRGDKSSKIKGVKKELTKLFAEKKADIEKAKKIFGMKKAFLTLKKFNRFNNELCNEVYSMATGGDLNALVYIWFHDKDRGNIERREEYLRKVKGDQLDRLFDPQQED